MKEFRKALFQIVGKELSEQETLDCWITLIEVVRWYQKVYENHKGEFNIEFPADEISAIETNAVENGSKDTKNDD